MQIAGVLQPPKRNKELSEKELKTIRMSVQKLSISSKDDIYYGLVSKDSKSGFFSNDRLLVLSSKDRDFFYLSKLPQGLIPFLSEAEVKSVKPKSRLTREEIRNQQVTLFRCAPAPGKISTFQVEFKKAGQVEQWLFTAGNSKTMHEWVQLINKYLLQDQPRAKTPEPKEEPKQNIQISESLPKTPEQRLTRPLSQVKPLQADTIPQQPLQPPPPPQPPRLPEGNTLNHSSTSKAYDSRIANMPFSDHASELRYLRKENPGLFQLSNDLSKPKLHPEDQPQNNQNRLNTQPSRNFKLADESKEYQVDSHLIADSRVDDSKSMVKAPSGREEAFKRSKNEPPVQREIQSRYPSRKELDPYSRAKEEEPIIKVLSVANSRGAITRNQYEPVISKGNSRAEQRNIVIREEQEEVARIVREPKPAPPSRKASSRNDFASRGSGRRWNQAFAQGSRRLEAYQQFVEAGFNLVRSIVNQLPLQRNQRQFLPLQSKTPYFTYYSEGILVALHFFETGRSISSTGPLFYEQQSCQLIKREFYNYNLVLGVTGNEGFIKVPLCAYFEYKGVIAVCKAELSEGFSQVTPKRYERQFDIIENQIHVRFMYGSFNAYLHPQGKYLILDNLRELIPQLPLPPRQQHFFRKEFLLTYPHIIEDMHTASEAHYSLTHQALPECLARLQGLETYAVNSADLAKVLHEGGLSLAYLPLLLQQTHAPHIKKLFTTELAVSVFEGIFRSELHHLVSGLPREQSGGDVSLQSANQALLDSCHALLELIFGYSNSAQSVWRVVVEQCATRFKVAMSKEDLLPGYLFSALLEKFGIICDFRRSSFSKHAVQFFVSSGNIPRDLLLGFRVRTRRYDLTSISPLVRDVEEILREEPSAENFRQLVGALKLREEGLPGFLQSVEPALLAYLCNFVPYGEHQEFQHLGIYNLLVLQPPCYWGAKVGLLAVKWCIKKHLSDEATRIYDLKQAENAFWLGEYNPAAGELYDFFAMYHASLGRYEQAVGLARQSLKNIGKVLGTGELPVADKHYQLGNIFFKMGRKDDALREYSRTRELLAAHGQTSIAEFAVILLKLGVLYLNFGKVAQCVQSALEALRIFGETGRSEADEIGTFQLLARCYQITKKSQELLRLGDLVAQKFNATQDPLTFQRMAKLVLYSRIGALSSPEGKAFSAIIAKLQQQQGRSSTEAFTFLHRKSQSDVLMKKVTYYLDNITSLYEQASRSDLFRRFRSLDPQTRSQPEEMLVVLQAIGAIVGFSYLRGSLRDE